MLAYIYSITDIFFDEDSSVPLGYTYDHCDDYWTCTGAVLENGISNDASGLESIINAILFVIIMLTSTNIILTIIFTFLIRSQQTVSSLTQNSVKGASDVKGADICLICGKHRSEFDIKRNSSSDDNQKQSSSNAWEMHTGKEHNIFAYFYYMFYVTDKEEQECDGIELFVKHCVQRNDVSFIPINMALSLEDEG